MSSFVKSVKRTLSMRKKTEPESAKTSTDSHNAVDAHEEENFSDYDDADDEIVGSLHRSLEQGEMDNKASKDTFLYKLIMSGNRKTEEQLKREFAAQQQLEAQARAAQQPPNVAA